MAAIINGKHGAVFLILGSLLAAGGLGTLVYAIHKGYEPSLKFGGAEVSLRKHSDAAAAEEAETDKKQPPAAPQHPENQGA